jgi:Ca-activated chloride channel family protein
MRRTGLVVYGAAGACLADVKLRPRIDAAPLISTIVDETPAGGATPLGRAVETAVQVLGGGETPGVVVVVTDGEDNCGVDPCDLGERLKETAPKTVVHIIGFMMGERRAVHAACLAEATSGLYVPARTFEELKTALRAALGCPRLSAPVLLARRKA